jgi:hypothetical protein
MFDMPIGYRVQWLAHEQMVGNGAVALCGVCMASGFDINDPSDSCCVCRGVGAVLRSDLRPNLAGHEPDPFVARIPVPAPAPEPTIMRWLRALLG